MVNLIANISKAKKDGKCIATAQWADDCIRYRQILPLNKLIYIPVKTETGIEGMENMVIQYFFKNL